MIPKIRSSVDEEDLFYLWQWSLVAGAAVSQALRAAAGCTRAVPAWRRSAARAAPWWLPARITAAAAAAWWRSTAWPARRRRPSRRPRPWAAPAASMVSAAARPLCLAAAWRVALGGWLARVAAAPAGAAPSVIAKLYFSWP